MKKEVNNEKLPVHHSFLQLPEDESKKNTLRNYEFVLDNFQKHFGDTDLLSITSEDILDFMSKISDGAKQNTKKLRFTLLSAFFNFKKNSLDPEFNNPCDNPALRKLFRAGIMKTYRLCEVHPHFVYEP
jgi:integrase/recombinase XerD